MRAGAARKAKIAPSGRDVHDFNVCFRDDPSIEVVAFTATQIPRIADRRHPGPTIADEIRSFVAAAIRHAGP